MDKVTIKVGLRPKVIFDILDAFILKNLDTPKTIGQLSKLFDVQHKTLSPHLKKMIKLGVIGTMKEEHSKRIFYFKKAPDKLINLLYSFALKLDTLHLVLKLKKYP